MTARTRDRLDKLEAARDGADHPRVVVLTNDDPTPANLDPARTIVVRLPDNGRDARQETRP